MAPLKNFYLDTVKGRPSAEAFNGLLCVYALLQRRMEEFFKAYPKLSAVKFNALLLIKYLGGSQGVSQNQLSQHLIVSPSNITRLIDRLIKDGLAERTVSETDRRIKVIKITSAGSSMLNKVFHPYGEMIQQSAYVLERKEVEQLSALLLKWFAKLEASGEEMLHE